MSSSNNETPGIGHNSGGVAGSRLRSFRDRIIRMESEKKEIADDIKDIYLEAKGIGFDVKILRKVVKRAQMEPDKVREEDELIDLYESSMANFNEMME